MTKNDEKKDDNERRQSAGAQTIPTSKTTSSSRKSPTSSEPPTYRSHTKVDIGILKDRADYRKSSFITETEEELVSVNYTKPSVVDRTTYVREKHVSYEDNPEIFHDAAENLDTDKPSTRSKSSATATTPEHRRYFKGPQSRKSAGGTEPTPSPESSSKISTSFDSTSKNKMDPTRPKSNIKNIDDSESGKRRTLIQYSTANSCCKCRNCGCES